jgi:hypothetical protein
MDDLRDPRERLYDSGDEKYDALTDEGEQLLKMYHDC